MEKSLISNGLSLGTSKCSRVVSQYKTNSMIFYVLFGFLFGGELWDFVGFFIHFYCIVKLFKQKN